MVLLLASTTPVLQLWLTVSISANPNGRTTPQFGCGGGGCVEVKLKNTTKNCPRPSCTTDWLGKSVPIYRSMTTPSKKCNSWKPNTDCTLMLWLRSTIRLFLHQNHKKEQQMPMVVGVVRRRWPFMSAVPTNWIRNPGFSPESNMSGNSNECLSCKNQSNSLRQIVITLPPSLFWITVMFPRMIFWPSRKSNKLWSSTTFPVRSIP